MISAQIGEVGVGTHPPMLLPPGSTGWTKSKMTAKEAFAQGANLHLLA